MEKTNNKKVNMSKILIKILGIALLPIYSLAYGVSHILKLEGREDMETIKEWIEMIKEV